MIKNKIKNSSSTLSPMPNWFGTIMLKNKSYLDEVFPKLIMFSPPFSIFFFQILSSFFSLVLLPSSPQKYRVLSGYVPFSFCGNEKKYACAKTKNNIEWKAICFCRSTVSDFDLLLRSGKHGATLISD